MLGGAMLFGLDSVEDLEERRRAKLFSDQRVTSEWRSPSAGGFFYSWPNVQMVLCSETTNTTPGVIVTGRSNRDFLVLQQLTRKSGTISHKGTKT